MAEYLVSSNVHCSIGRGSLTIEDHRRLVAPLLVAEESSESVWREVEDSFVWPMARDTERTTKL
jgi:hypothetical protein